MDHFHAHMGHDMPGHDMPHGGHGGHDMPMPSGPRCSMQMLWNTQIEDTCVVFESWHISSKTTFVLSILAIIALGVFYEWLRVFSGGVDRRIALALAAKDKGKTRGAVSARSTPDIESSEEVGLLTGATVFKPGVAVPFTARLLRATLYASTVFLSFFLMLIFMTFNAYLIVAVVVGAGIGNYVFSPTMDVDAVLAGGANNKGMACH